MVAIKDFEMPRGCYECPLMQVHTQGDYCSVSEACDILEELERPECCPLVEVEVKQNETCD